MWRRKSSEWERGIKAPPPRTSCTRSLLTSTRQTSPLAGWPAGRACVGPRAEAALHGLRVATLPRSSQEAAHQRPLQGHHYSIWRRGTDGGRAVLSHHLWPRVTSLGVGSQPFVRSNTCARLAHLTPPLCDLSSAGVWRAHLCGLTLARPGCRHRSVWISCECVRASADLRRGGNTEYQGSRPGNQQPLAARVLEAGHRVDTRHPPVHRRGHPSLGLRCSSPD